MKTAAAWSIALIGIEGEPVEVEVAKGGGLPRIALVGLPDAALTQAKDRVRASVIGAGLEWHTGLLTINLTPANLPKAGTHYDLAIAAAVLAVTGQVPAEAMRRHIFFGELGLDGRVRRVPGILPALLAASRAGFESAFVPAAQAAEADLVDGIRSQPIRDLKELQAILTGEPTREWVPPLNEDEGDRERSATLDFRDVQGHVDGKWAMEVAAAGRHHVYLHGAPGVGKTMLASRLPGILPPLDGEEAIEVSALHSLAGKDLSGGLLTLPPYADPHHSSTAAAIVGGGVRFVRPGAISLAHRGVLFLDELGETKHTS